MYVKVVSVLKVADHCGLSTLVLPPFRTEPKYGHPADLIALTFRKALLGVQGQESIDWRGLGLRSVIIAVDDMKVDSASSSNQDEWNTFTKHFSGQPGVNIDSNKVRVQEGDALFMSA